MKINPIEILRTHEVWQAQRVLSEIAETGALISTNEPLSRHTTFRIGGPADIFAVAKTTEHLINIINICREFQAPFLLLGAGSNILVSDQGIRGVVIKNQSSSFSIENDHVLVDSGYIMPKFASDIARHGLSGCEFIQSIPGTIGGGARQNARFRNLRNFDSYNGLTETKETDHYFGELVEEVITLTDRGELVTLSNTECGFSYTGITSTALKKNSSVITRVRMRLKIDSVSAIQDRMQQYREWRSRRVAKVGEDEAAQPVDNFTGARARQPVGATAGCVFFNVPNEHNHPSGRLIDLCGLKGKRSGNAKISEDHANYIVNLGGAKAADVLALIDLAKREVFARFGVHLIEEIELVGE